MITLIGPAGSGKSVQGQMLVEENAWMWLSIGQLLRDENDEEIKAIQATGKLVPFEIIQKVLAKALDQISDLGKVILDGCPRSIEQARWLIEGVYGKSLDLVVVVDVGVEELVKRIELRGRVDDTRDILNERMRIYHNEIDPLIDYIVKKNVKVSHVNGDGTEMQVHERIVEVLQECNLE